MPRQKRPATTRSYHERVLRSLVEIERDPARPLALEALAREAFLSPFHFHRVFSALVGEGPAEYQRRLRLEQAAHDLALSKETIQRIAKRASYARQESFTRAFRARFGSTPSVFRAEHRGKWTRLRQASRARGGWRSFHRCASRSSGMSARTKACPPSSIGWRVGLRQRATRLPSFSVWPTTTPRSLRLTNCASTAASRSQAMSGAVRAKSEWKPCSARGTPLRFHRGSFATLATTYRWLALDYLPKEGLVLRRAPAVEIYLTPPDVEATDGLTEVLLPVD